MMSLQGRQVSIEDVVFNRSHRTVSVVIPAFNCERFVAEAIDSVLQQTLPPHEIIVVNDGSTDGTAHVLSGFEPRIRVISQANAGLAAARNAGISVATGYWIGFLDADDTWLPAKLERQLEAASESRIAMVWTDRFNIGERGGLPEVQSQIQEMYAGDIFVDLLLLGNRVTASSVLVRTDVCRALGGFKNDLHACEDWDLWIRVAENHEIAVCREPLVCYRFHGGMMSGDPLLMQAGRNDVVRRGLASPRGQALPGRLRRRILAAAARTNAWDASRRNARAQALKEYLRAFKLDPFQTSTYIDFLRFLLGRHA